MKNNIPYWMQSDCDESNELNCSLPFAIDVKEDDDCILLDKYDEEYEELAKIEKNEWFDLSHLDVDEDEDDRDIIFDEENVRSTNVEDCSSVEALLAQVRESSEEEEKNDFLTLDIATKDKVAKPEINMNLKVGNIVNGEEVFQIVEELLENYNFMTVEERLYVFQNYWVAISKANSSRILATLIEKISLGRRNLMTRQVKEIYNQLLMKPHIYRCKDSFYVNTNVIVFRNGTYDILLEEFFENEFDPEDYQFAQIPYDYNEVVDVDDEAIDFINRFCSYDEKRKEYLWELIGYLLSNLQRKNIILLYGPGNCGKSTLANFIQATIGIDLCVAIPADKLSDQFNLGELPGKKLCVDGDMKNAPLKASTIAVLKQLSGADWLQANSKFEKQYYFFNTAKLLWCSNHKIKLSTSDETEYVASRLKAFELFDSIPSDEQREDMKDILARNRDYFVKMALEGVSRYLKNGSVFSNADNAYDFIENSYLENSAIAIENFLDDCCVYDLDGKISSEDLYEHYVEYQKNRGKCPCSLKAFVLHLNNKEGIEKYRTKKKRFIKGISFK